MQSDDLSPDHCYLAGRDKTERKMTIQKNEFDASELCSRKLWQMVNNDRTTAITNLQLEQAIEELAERRHYLAELSRMGKLSAATHNS